MRILLDTHVLLWAASSPDRLGASQRDVTAAEQRLISAASTWELAIKASLGKLDLATDVRSWLRRAVRELHAQPLSITADHAVAVQLLPPVHRDPFDRLLIAQALNEGAVLLTADRRLLPYGEMVRLIS